jgi:hypothetical protein
VHRIINADIVDIRYTPDKSVVRSLEDDDIVPLSGDSHEDPRGGAGETDALAIRANPGRPPDACNTFDNFQQQVLVDGHTKTGSRSGRETPFKEIGFLVVEDYHKLSLRQRDFLNSEGVFQVPDQTIMESLLDQYFLHVEPYLPLIGENDFWHPDTRKSGEGSRVPSDSISLFVFNSMMVACSAVSPSPRNSLYRKANIENLVPHSGNAP